jgi:hypothetical protein
MGITRVWVLAEPTRKSRFGLWAVGLNWTLAVVLAHVVNINPMLFGMWAVVTTLAVQLAAPIVNADDLNSLKMPAR